MLLPWKIKSIVPLYCWHTYDAVNSAHTECVAWNNMFTFVLFINLHFLIIFHKTASNFTKILQRGAEVIVRLKRRADMTKLI
jgi:hypothetical protein